MKFEDFFKKKITIFLILFFLIIQSSSADDYLDQGIKKIKEGNYLSAINLIKKGCPVLDSDIYNETIWKCNFNLAFAYQMLSRIVIGNDTKIVRYPNGPLDKARFYYRKSINISKLKTDKVIFQDSILLADIEIAIGNYNEAELILNDLEKRMNRTGYPLQEQSGEKYDWLKGIFRKLRTFIAKNIETELLKGNIGPFGFTHIQINPKIMLLSEKDLTFEYLSLTYEDLLGLHTVVVERDSNNQFLFNQILKLNRRRIFPFDTYHTQIININPPRLSHSKIPLSIYGSTPYKGFAEFDKDKIEIEIQRNNFSIILFYFFFLVTLISLIYFNKSIKKMREASFKPSNFEGKTSFIITMSSFILTLISIYDWNSILNIYFYILIILLFLSLIRLLLRYIHLKRNKI